jgi:hypothetical protein
VWWLIAAEEHVHQTDWSKWHAVLAALGALVTLWFGAASLFRTTVGANRVKINKTAERVTGLEAREDHTRVATLSTEFKKLAERVATLEAKKNHNCLRTEDWGMIKAQIESLQNTDKKHEKAHANLYDRINALPQKRKE